MDPIIVAIDDRLAEAGQTLPVAGHLAWGGYSLGGRDLVLPQGADYDMMLTNAGEGILATGILRAHVEAACDRCLEQADFDITAEVDEYYLFEEPVGDEGEADEDAEEDVDYLLVGDDSTIDLAPALHAALLMETPFIILCKSDCKGLCPHCGANLNEGDCGCAAKAAEEDLAASPFAVLKDVDFGDGAGE